MRGTVLFCAVVMAAAACHDATRHGEVRERHGDTLVVRTASGSVWGDSVRLVEDLRIGTLHGAEGYMFGRIDQMAVGRGGRIYVYDGTYKALRMYDSAGTYVRTIGRTGSGPGEYRIAVGLDVLSDGRVALWDPRNGRVTLYSPDGDFRSSWRVTSGLYTAQALMVDSADRVYVKALFAAIQQGPWHIGLLEYDQTGRFLDSIPGPYWPEEEDGFFSPREVWTLHPGGYLVAGRSDRYAFDVRRPGGVLRIERQVAPVPVTRGERDEYDAVARWFSARNPNAGAFTQTASVKPAYSSLTVSNDGRIWVERAGPSVRIPPAERTAAKAGEAPPITWRQPHEYDVFDADGHYLGRVPVPRGASFMVMRGDRVWGVTRGEMDEPYVVRFHIER